MRILHASICHPVFERAVRAGRGARPCEGETGTTEVKVAQAELLSSFPSSRGSDGSVSRYATREKAIHA